MIALNHDSKMLKRGGYRILRYLLDKLKKWCILHLVKNNKMKPDKRIKPLYRKVNTKARRVRHQFGSDFRFVRNTKNDTIEQVKGSMSRKKRRGLDYTPLFKFLLSRVGQEWDEVFSEAKSRLDKIEPIFWVVALKEMDKRDYVRVGESSYFSGLFVDENGILQLTKPTLKAEDLVPFCTCCTHTLNGEIFGKKSET